MENILKKSYKMFINGEWVNSSNGITVKTYAPYNNELLSEFPDASESDVDLAVKSAKEAFKTWRKTTVKERAKILNKIADIIDENKDLLATVETMDNGKPIRETTLVDIPLAATHFRYFAGCILADEGQATVLDEKFLSIILREPIGVVGQIIPWNFPFLMAAWKLAPALAAAEKLIPATLELGGKSANIILDDADMEKALEGAQLGILFNQGQVCCAGSRIFVQEGIYDEFIEKLVKKFENIKIGNPLDPSTVMGSQIDARQVKTILDYVEIAKQEGGVILTGGVKYTENGCDKGNFVRPTLITNVKNTCRVSQEEIFGPVAVVIKFKTDDEVIAQANNSEYGLGGAVFTKNINRALRLAREIQTGRVWINTYNQIPEHAPFGGYKKSGIGRETHKVILEHYTQMKNILIDLEEGASGLY